MRRNFEKGLISLPLCLENGTPIGDEPEYNNQAIPKALLQLKEVLRHFQQHIDETLKETTK